jgi:hypothetical protein
MHTGLPKDVRSWIFSVSTSPSGLLLIAGGGLVVARIRIFDRLSIHQKTAAAIEHHSITTIQKAIYHMF